jgi:hypothetical protein
MALDLDAAAKIELARHKDGLLYAERQQLKRGEYEAVAQKVLKRAKLRAGLLVALAVVYGVLAALSKTQTSGFIFIVAGVSFIDYSHAKRTAETIRRLAEEAELGSTPGPG